MHTLIDGKAIADKIQAKAAEHVAKLKAQGVTPKLEVILVGDDKPSATYVKKKGEAAKKLGMDFHLEILPADITTAALVQHIETLQHTLNLSGLIVQLPLPEQLYTNEVLNAIHPEIDVDCLTNVNLGKLVMKTNYLVPPTPGAVITILHDLNIPIAGKNVTIIGMGALVGKPLAIMLVNEGASITTVNSRTHGTKEKCLSADIIVTGVGKKDTLRGDMVKDGAIVIDTGVDFENGKMHGDVNVKEVLEKAAHVTPTPGGVGPITVARLLWNTVLCAEKNLEMGYDAKQQNNANLANPTKLQNDDAEKIIFPDLSYEINGILFQVHKDIGKYCNEKQVCDRIEFYLKQKQISYERELVIPAGFEGERAGRNRLDFIIDDKIILEIKTKKFLETADYFQIKRYLHAYHKKLGLLVNFREERIQPKRILNPEVSHKIL